MLTVLGLSALFTLLFVGLALVGLWLAYRMTWRGPQRWMEATRHQHKLALKVGRWIWFRWIHLDCQYWIVHLDFSVGPIELRGRSPEGPYWSFTYNTWTEVNPSVNSETVKLDEDGGYRITFATETADGNWVPVRKGARLGVIYFRIYETPANFPSVLPEVWQNGVQIVKGAYS